MATYIEMPKLSDTMTEGTLVKWRKNKGDKVEVGDIIAEVETDKATMEMEAFDDGILGETYVDAGQKIAVGQKIGVLVAEGEKVPDASESAASSKKEKSGKSENADQSGKADGDGKSGDSKKSADSQDAGKSGKSEKQSGGGRVKASPLAKKIAQQKGVDLSRLTGSGPGGRIVAKDVESAPANQGGSSSANAAPAAQAVPPVPAGENDQVIPLSGMRRIIAERLLASKTTIPHFYLNIEVDVAEMMKLRAEVNAAAEKAGQPKTTVNDYVLKAAVVAATRIPAVNAAFAGDSIIQYGSVNLSVAIAVDDGLVTPVIRDAQKKSIREISSAVKDLASRARNKKLKPEEYAGGTITVTNLGSYGIESFSAIINPPQSLILSVGAIVKKPVVNAKGEIVVAQRMAIGLSADHRVVDGAIGAHYLAELRQLIENPALMLI